MRGFGQAATSHRGLPFVLVAPARGIAHQRRMITVEAPHLARYAQGYWSDTTVGDLAFALADADPDAVVLYAGEAVHRRGEIVADAVALAAGMAMLGRRPGDVVSFMTPNWAEAAVINLACAIAGLVVNPIVHIYRDAEVAMMLADSDSRLFFVASQFRGFDYAAMAARLDPALPALAGIAVVRGTRDGMSSYADLVSAGRGARFDRPQVDPRAVKLLLYTSGTTGRPKGVLHSHNSLARVVRVAVEHWGIAPGDAIVMPSPVTHISGYSNGLELPFVAGTRTVLMESWNATEAVALVNRHGVTGTVAATPFLTELAQAATAAATRLPSLRFFACGGAAVPPEVIPAANAAFANCRAFRVFGSSEVPLVTIGYPAAADAHRAATTDGAIADYDVRIADDAGLDVEPGTPGEILARGPAMFLGYADTAQTAEAITGDGYFRTGDIGYVIDGAIVVTGRKKDLIIRGGENVSAKEIEDVLHTHPAVREAAVVAMPHARLGEGICAFVILVPSAPADAAALAAHVGASGLARQKIPERFTFVDAFPRTASGKIRKDRLREIARG